MSGEQRHKMSFLQNQRHCKADKLRKYKFSGKAYLVARQKQQDVGYQERVHDNTKQVIM